MKMLAQTIAIAITCQQRRKLEKIDAENYAPVLKKARKDVAALGKRFEVSDDELVYALKQYYSLAALNPHNMHAVSDVVDPLWHAHVLHTAKYGRFCEESIGYFMHHEPLDHEDAEKLSAVKDVYEYTLEILNVLFAGHVNLTCWPAAIGPDRLICWHFNITKQPDKPVEACWEPDARFAETRKKFGIEAVLAQ